jgi:hypothetical protein
MIGQDNFFVENGMCEWGREERGSSDRWSDTAFQDGRICFPKRDSKGDTTGLLFTTLENSEPQKVVLPKFDRMEWKGAIRDGFWSSSATMRWRRLATSACSSCSDMAPKRKLGARACCGERDVAGKKLEKTTTTTTPLMLPPPPTVAVTALELGDAPAAKLHGPLVVGGTWVGWRAWQWVVTKSGINSEAQRDP